jgi:hypothetical protein
MMEILQNITRYGEDKKTSGLLGVIGLGEKVIESHSTVDELN